MKQPMPKKGPKPGPKGPDLARLLREEDRLLAGYRRLQGKGGVAGPAPGRKAAPEPAPSRFPGPVHGRGAVDAAMKFMGAGDKKKRKRAG